MVFLFALASLPSLPLFAKALKPADRSCVAVLLSKGLWSLSRRGVTRGGGSSGAWRDVRAAGSGGKLREAFSRPCAGKVAGVGLRAARTASNSERSEDARAMRAARRGDGAAARRSARVGARQRGARGPGPAKDEQAAGPLEWEGRCVSGSAWWTSTRCGA